MEHLEVEYGGGQTLVKEQIVQRSDRLCYDTENLKKEYGGQWPNETANYILFKDEHSMLRNRHMIIFGRIYASSMNVGKSTESSWLTLTPSPGVGLQPNVCIHSSDCVGSDPHFRDGLQSGDRTQGQGRTPRRGRTLEWGQILGLGRTRGRGRPQGKGRGKGEADPGAGLDPGAGADPGAGVA